MKLYGFIANEKKANKSQGGQKQLTINLTHETEYGDWQTLPDRINKVEVYFNWNSGKPRLTIRLPKSWKFLPSKNKDEKEWFLFGYDPELDDFTHPKIPSYSEKLNKYGIETKAK